MERNLERKTLSFGKGMTNVPSDLLSDDSELLESDGFIFRDGEMKPIQNPVKIGEIAGQKIMYVHKMADYENIIAYDEDRTIYWYVRGSNGIEMPPNGVSASFEVGKVKDIKSTGNTLIVATEDGLRYLKYKGNKYKNLGTELPKPEVHFYMFYAGNVEADTSIKYEGFVNSKELEIRYDANGDVCYIEKIRYIKNNGDNAVSKVTVTTNPAAKTEKFMGYSVTIDDENNKNLFQTAVVGHVSSIINKAAEDNVFLFPFFVRSALKLFDGTYARISNPVICYPCVTANCNSHLRSQVARITMYGYTLSYSISIPNKEDWNDIVKDISLFATKGVQPFKLDKDWKFAYPDEVYGKAWHDSLSGDVYEKSIYSRNSSTGEPCMRIMPEYKTEDDIREELLGKTVFYKIEQIGINSSKLNGTTQKAEIKDGVLSNLETQEQLQKDDYYGWAHYVFDKMFTYNGRLNSFGAKRKPFYGFNHFTAIDGEPRNEYKYYVKIEANFMSTWVESEAGIGRTCALTGWFYYPDPNASEVIIYDTQHQRGIRFELEQHPRLNGAYHFGKLENDVSWDTSISIPSTDNGAQEDLNSQIFTSVVNNPFVFEASGDNTVGTGRILGIAANTEAVSQGQFGQYPLLVFTDEGIYGMSVNSEGLYSASHPISREVCNEDSPFVPTDRLVYFTSKRGLMASSGGQVACMSEQLRGRTPRNFISVGDGKFLEFLANCLIAYDYRDSLLRIFSQDKDYQYIYNMVDKTFSVANSGMTAKAVVNDYPDNLIQDIDGNVYSLMAKPDINDDTDNYRGSFTTRPLKMGGSMNLKSLRAVKHLFDSDNGKIAMEIYGSNDCKHWNKLISLGGKPWKYFTFKYALTNFKATDSFAGSIVEVQNRREYKIR